MHKLQEKENGIKDDEVRVYLNYHEYLMLYDMEM